MFVVCACLGDTLGYVLCELLCCGGCMHKSQGIPVFVVCGDTLGYVLSELLWLYVGVSLLEFPVSVACISTMLLGR